MERESAILKHEAIVVPFLKEAIQEGAYLKKPPRFSEDQWVRLRNIGGVYNGSPAVFEDLAHMYGLSHERIRQLNITFLANLWSNSSDELKDRYPLNEVLTARKLLSQTSKERLSLNRGGTSLRIKAQVDSGVTDREKISENTGISKSTISNLASTTLKDWGIDIPRKTASHREVLEQLDKETDDKKIQESLDRIPYYAIRYDLEWKREASQFSSLYPLIREAGFRSRDNHPFAISLETAGIPITRKYIVVNGAKPQTQTYYILLSRHKDRAIQVLQQDKGLQRFQRESS